MPTPRLNGSTFPVGERSPSANQTRFCPRLSTVSPKAGLNRDHLRETADETRQWIAEGSARPAGPVRAPQHAVIERCGLRKRPTYVVNLQGKYRVAHLWLSRVSGRFIGCVRGLGWCQGRRLAVTCAVCVVKDGPRSCAAI